MAIADQLTQLSQVKADIKQALIDKGVDMTDVPFTGYAEKINVMSGLTPSVISAVKNCRLLLPYINDTIDNSLYSVPLSTNGAVLGSNGATFADGKYVGISDAINDYLTSYNTTQPYTFEVILTLSNTSKYSYIINALTNGGSYLIVHDNKLVYRNAGNTTELISIPYTYTTKKHIALVYDGTTIKLYLDGVEKGSTTTKNTAKSDGYCLLGYSTSGYSISGVCGGVRLTSKALSPAEFSDRPMELWNNLDFTEGDKTYLYKDGILEPSIPLGNGLSIKNNVIYTNAAGGTNWSISYPIEQNTTLYVKLTCMADAGSPGNEAYLSANFGGKNGVIRFPGDGEVNDHLTLGILAGLAATSFNLYFYTYGSAMGIEEIWIE